ncbi:FAD/NAD(P)-binding domain-containing protein [Daedaleopsis nitida]|nr:FAD/NAD(P)-binding domain-containing protein [Daedaleopsis nitida]
MTTSPPRIAIVGGGPAGLILLLTLHRRGVTATLYERETGFSARAHLGGTLDLGWDSGQRALRENGLAEEFQKHSRPEGDEMRICDAAGNVLLYNSGEKGADSDPRDIRPEIDRSVLRKMLLDAVPAGSIKWGHAVSSARTLGNGEHELTFSDGSTAVCDILVGADGGNSRVRPLVSTTTPAYSGVTGAEISLAPEVAALPDMQDVAAAVGQGSAFVAQNNKVLACQRNGDGRIRAYAWHRGPVEWTVPSQPSEARRVLLEIYKDWAPWMRKIIENCDEAAIYQRTLYLLPVGHRWDHVNGVTIIGDAAHLMSPAAGAGANLAMLDGLELGLVLSEAILARKSVEEREAAVAAWEEKMFSSAGKMAGISAANLDAFIAPDAPHSSIEKVKSFMLNAGARRDA